MWFIGLTFIVGQIIVLFGLFAKRKTRLILLGCLITLIAFGIGYATIGTWTRHPIAIYFDNASDSKYDVAVNQERFRIDERSYVYKQISWESLSGSKDPTIEIRIVSTAPKVEEVERLKIRVQADRTYLYNIGGVNKYTLDTQTYRER